MTLKVDGNAFSAGEVKPKTVAIKNLNMYTTKSDGYVRWLAGHIVVNGVEYAVSASNSGASKTDKLIVATLTDGANTAAFTFVATSTTITANNEVLIGYVDASSRLTLFSASAQPDLSGYTLTVSTTDINVNGEGYFCSAFAWAVITGRGVSGETGTANAGLNISVDSTTIFNTTNSHTSSTSQVDDTSCAVQQFAALTKFNSNLTVTLTATTSNTLSTASNASTYKHVVYLVK